MDFIRNLQGWGYVSMIFFLTIGFYIYIYYLYRSQKNGAKDYEKYSDMALNDDIDDTLIEGKHPQENKKDNEER